jgi:hypothetical protein
MRDAPDQHIAQSVPDLMALDVGQDPRGDRADIQRAMPLDHVGQAITQMHEARDDPAVDRRHPQFVAKHSAGQVGHLVGDDNRRARSGHTGHLAKCAFGIIEVIESADAQHGVELSVAKRQRFGLALDQSAGSLACANPAGLELRPGDVDAHDAPVVRHPGKIDAVSHSHVEQPQSRFLRQVPEYPVACSPLSAVAEPGEFLPEPKLRPELAIIELLGHAVVLFALLLDHEDFVPQRIGCAAAAAGQCRGPIV